MTYNCRRRAWRCAFALALDASAAFCAAMYDGSFWIRPV
jgi:hypothetical protein